MTACWVGGLAGCLAWTSMLAVVFGLPALSSQDEVVGYWREHELRTQVVIAVMACGFPGIVLFLAGHRTLWSPARRHWGAAATVMASMFTTALVVALGLASAAGQLAVASRAHDEVAYALHVGAFVLAAPAAGLGAGFFLCVLAAGRDVDPWSRAIAVVGFACNLGPLGGHFALAGVWNTGNGWLGGMTLPVASLVLYIAVSSAAQLGRGTSASRWSSTSSTRPD